MRYDYIQFFCISADSSTYFGYPHPSSGAYVNCNYNIWHWSNRIAAICWCGGVVLTPPRQRTVAVWFDQCQML